jgi:hypothetical protein
VKDRLPVGVIDRIDDQSLFAVVEDDRAMVSGLVAVLRVEDGAIESDPTWAREDDCAGISRR